MKKDKKKSPVYISGINHEKLKKWCGTNAKTMAETVNSLVEGFIMRATVLEYDIQTDYARL